MIADRSITGSVEMMIPRITELSTRIFKDQDRRKTMRYFVKVQRISAGVSSFLHGAQDSQKFIGVYMLGLTFINGNNTIDSAESFKIPIYITLACAARADPACSVRTNGEGRKRSFS